jgi:predicted AAA+ superfamily ATPase
MILTEKFYLFDVGVANHLARRQPREGTPEFGHSLEQLLLMELMAYRAYRAQDMEIAFWRTSTGQEVDFIINDKALAVALKSRKRVNVVELHGLTALADDGPVRRRVLVSLEREPRELRDAHGKIELVPWWLFLERLWSGGLV